MLAGHDGVGQRRGGARFLALVAGKRDPADAPVLAISAAVAGHEMLDEAGAWENFAGLGEV